MNKTMLCLLGRTTSAILRRHFGQTNPYGRSFPSPRSYGERVRVMGANLRSSLPGLTRQSIDLRKNFLAKKMDARVKPAHDELAKQLKLAPMRVRVRGRVHTGPFVPLTPSLSPRQERGEGAARCLLHGLCINFTGAF